MIRLLLPVLGLVIAGLTGWAVVDWLWPRSGRPWAEVLSRACLGMAVGLGLHSCATFLWLLLSPTHVVNLYIMDLALLAGCWFLARGARLRNAAPSHPARPLPRFAGCSAPNTLAWVLAATVVPALVMVLITLSAEQVRHPHGTWDSWMIWNFRARFFFLGGAGWASGIINAWTWSLPDYPIFLPLTVTRLWHYLGTDLPFLPGALSVLFTLLTLLLLFAAIARLRGLARAALATLFLAATPLFLRAGASQCADVPIGFFILAALTALFPAFAAHAREPRTTATSQAAGSPKTFALVGLLAATAAWTKNEGILFLAIVLFLLVLTAFLQRWLAPERQTTAWRSVFLTLAGAGVVLVFLIAMKSMVSGSNYLLRDRQSGGIVHLLLDLHRHDLILRYLIGLFLVLPNRWLAWSVILYLLLQSASGVRHQQRGSRVWALLPFEADALYRVPTILTALAILAMLAGYYGVYAVTPLDLDYQLSTSLERVIIQVWPAFVFLLFLTLRSPANLAGHSSPAPSRLS